jgi:hypothetical protein
LPSPAFSCKSSPRSSCSSRRFWKTVSWANDVDGASSESACGEIDSTKSFHFHWAGVTTATDARRCPFSPGARRLVADNKRPAFRSSSNHRSLRSEWAEDMAVRRDGRKG